LTAVWFVRIKKSDDFRSLVALAPGFVGLMNITEGSILAALPRPRLKAE